jgi:hypothetical protein
MGHAKAFVKGFPYLEQRFAQRFVDKNFDGIADQGVAEGSKVKTAKGHGDVVQGTNVKTVAKADLGKNKLNLPKGYGDVVQPQKLKSVAKAQGVAEGFNKNVVKSVKVGNFRHDLVNTGMGWQVRIYNGDELYDTGLSKNSEQKGLAALDDSVAYTKKQLNIKDQGVAGSQLEETYHDDDEFFEAYGVMEYSDEMINEAEYQGRKVTLNKPMQGDVKKFKVYTKNPKGNVVKVNFGDPNSTIKKNNPARRKSFRARHNCDNPGPKTGARYWSCRKW